MVVNAEQLRVKALLTEAITMLCKNGLCYQRQFSVEGLLGITLDDKDVFLININESIQEPIDEEEMEPENPVVVKKPLSPKVTKPEPVPSPPPATVSSDDDIPAEPSPPPSVAASPGQWAQNRRRRSRSPSESPKAKKLALQAAPVEEEEEEYLDSKDDIILIKEERLSDDESERTSRQSRLNLSSTSLQPASLEQAAFLQQNVFSSSLPASISSQNNSFLQDPANSDSSFNDSMGNMSGSFGGAGCSSWDQALISQASLQAEGTASHNQGLRCSICNRAFTFKSAMVRHMRSVHFRERGFDCHVCQKAFSRNETLQFHLASRHAIQLTSDSVRLSRVQTDAVGLSRVMSDTVGLSPVLSDTIRNRDSHQSSSE